MRKNVWHHIALSSLIVMMSAPGAFSKAAIFSNYSVDQAKNAAQKEQKLLVIDFTASWCGPCKKMEATTWSDSAVQTWIKENAIAIQIDTDANEKDSEAFKIDAMPTVVLFTPQSGAREFGRNVGFMNPAELLHWLESAKSGKSAKEIEKEQAQSDPTAIWEHISKARATQNAGKNAEALEEYLWLWKNIPPTDSNVGELRRSMVPLEMKNLSATYPPAKEKFGALRDAAEAAENRSDWLLLNAILDDSARTLAWFDKIKIDPTKRDLLKQHTSLLEPVLFSKSRWADAAAFLYPDPLAKIKEVFQKAEEMKRPRPDTEVAKDFDPFPNMVLLVYGAYVGAGKEAEAQKIADECLRLDNTPAMRDALDNMAKGMRQARAATQTVKTTPAGKATPTGKPTQTNKAKQLRGKEIPAE